MNVEITEKNGLFVSQLVPASASDRSEGKPVHACFNKRLVYGGDTGTILYGTVFMYEKNKVFSVEDDVSARFDLSDSCFAARWLRGFLFVLNEKQEKDFY